MATNSIKKLNTIAFPFVVEQLEKLSPIVRPMFGCHAIYVAEKIMLILRNKANHDVDNGVWVATSAEHHESLKLLFPFMRSIKLLGIHVTNWQNLPYTAIDFEESAVKVCGLILKNDPRIGKIPKSKKRKNR